MYLHALATAVPAATFTQSECWQIAERSSVRERLKKRSMLILHTILRGDPRDRDAAFCDSRH
jgi:hypothetical protein